MRFDKSTATALRRKGQTAQNTPTSWWSFIHAPHKWYPIIRYEADIILNHFCPIGHAYFLHYPHTAPNPDALYPLHPFIYHICTDWYASMYVLHQLLQHLFNPVHNIMLIMFLYQNSSTNSNIEKEFNMAKSLWIITSTWKIQNSVRSLQCSALSQNDPKKPTWTCHL